MIRSTPERDAQELLAATRRQARDADAPPVLMLMDVIRRNLVLVVAAVALGVAIAVAWTLLTPRLYTAEAVVRIPPPPPDPGEPPGAPNPAEFRPILLNRQNVSQVLASTHLDQRWTPDRFIDEVCALDVVKGTAIASVTVTLADPVLAASAANDIVERAIKLLRTLSDEEGKTAKTQFESVVVSLGAQAQDARAKYLTYRESTQIETLRAEVMELLDARGSLVTLTTQIAQKRAELDRARIERDARPATLSTERAVSGDPAVQEAARDATGRSAQGLKMNEQSVNLVKQELDLQVGTLTAELAGLEKKRAHIVDDLGLARPSLDKLNTLYQREVEMARLESEYGLANKAYQDAVSHLHSLTADVMRRKPEIQVVDRAIAPSKPNSRGFITKLVVALAVALACAGVLIAWREAKRYERG